jgi:hypothetical protein
LLSICAIDIVGLVIIGNFELVSVGLPQLDENLSQTDYMDNLADIFID